MVLRRLCTGAPVRQALQLTGQAQHPRPLTGTFASLQEDRLAIPNSERCRSTYGTSTSDQCTEQCSPNCSEKSAAAQHNVNVNTTISHGLRAPVPLSNISRGFQLLTLGSSGTPVHKPFQCGSSLASLSQLAASFSTSAFLAAPPQPLITAGAPEPSEISETSTDSRQTTEASASRSNPVLSHPLKDCSQQRRPFKPRAGPNGIQTSGARQLATEAQTETALVSSVQQQRPGKARSALPPLPPRKKTKALTKTAQHIMNIIDQETVAELQQKKNYPDFRPGDVLELDLIVPENRRRTAVVRGVCLGRRNAGVGSSFVIRRVVAGEGMEYTYPLYSPNIQKIKIIERRPVRRAKLYYLRDWNPRECTV